MLGLLIIPEAPHVTLTGIVGREEATRTRQSRRARKPRPVDGERGRLQAHDPFELIRWLALSQPDPRKALAELVQNSLDAGARHIRVVRLRERGVPCLKITDDGAGVIAEMERREALRYIATHVGHSRKRSLSPQERMTLMTQGQYGIGLLGFWSLGEALEMRTVLPGQPPYRLILHRDRPDFLIQPLRGRLPLDQRWTEIVVSGLHAEAMPTLVGRRAADYLAAELRGQLLAREVDLVIEDRMSRGTAQKVIAVRPPRFLGERVDGLTALHVAGHPPARLEIYVGAPADGTGSRGLAVYSAGTLVADGFHELGALGLDHAPWTDARLTGLVDFPAFQVAPGSRRGVIPDEAAGAFATALSGIEPILVNLLEALDRRRVEALDRTLIRDLQRAFRDFYRQRPRYSMLPVHRSGDAAAGPAAQGGDADLPDGSAAAAPAGARPPEDDSEPDVAIRPAALLPPGPLESVRITPDPLRVECRGSRRLRATALDAANHTIVAPVRYEWSVEGPIGTLSEAENETGRNVLQAADQPGEGRVVVAARSEDRDVRAAARVVVLEELGNRSSDEGIPRPEFVDEPGVGWRSRMVGDRWQVNSGHREYRAIADRPQPKLRYLAMLFAKEVVLRSSQDPRLERPLEQLVEIAAFADRNLADRKRKGGSGAADGEA